MPDAFSRRIVGWQPADHLRADDPSHLAGIADVRVPDLTRVDPAPEGLRVSG